jgi:hypothetical protein
MLNKTQKKVIMEWCKFQPATLIGRAYNTADATATAQFADWLMETVDKINQFDRERM